MSVQSPELKVGILVIVVIVLIAFMSIKVSESPSILGRSRHTFVVVDNAEGLITGSAVKMAGIKIGVIRSIELEGGRARIEMELSPDVPLKTTAVASVKASGILGDKHIEIMPGASNDPVMPEGHPIMNVKDGSSLDQVMEQVGKITSSLQRVTTALEAATVEGAKDTPIGRIVNNIEVLSKDLSEMVHTNRGKIDDIVDNIHSLTETLDDSLSQDGEEGFRVAWHKVSNSVTHLENALKNIEEISDKVNRGEGTIGRLINDEKTVDELNTAIANVNNFLDSGSKIETSIDFHSEVLANPGLTKSYLGIKIQPGLDRYYELAVIDDPKGVIEKTDTQTTTGANTEMVEETKTYHNRIKFTALFAKNFYDLTIKGGVMENAGGIGVDYHLFKRDVRLSVEAFDFQETKLRAFVRFNVFKGFYIVGGGDDLVSKENNASAFFGAGLFLTNDDLKLLLSRLSL